MIVKFKNEMYVIGIEKKIIDIFEGWGKKEINKIIRNGVCEERKVKKVMMLRTCKNKRRTKRIRSSVQED